jgi:hypothetical protein
VDDMLGGEGDAGREARGGGRGTARWR